MTSCADTPTDAQSVLESQRVRHMISFVEEGAQTDTGGSCTDCKGLKTNSLCQLLPYSSLGGNSLEMDNSCFWNLAKGRAHFHIKISA